MCGRGRADHTERRGSSRGDEAPLAWLVDASFPSVAVVNREFRSSADHQAMACSEMAGT